MNPDSLDATAEHGAVREQIREATERVLDLTKRFGDWSGAVCVRRAERASQPGGSRRQQCQVPGTAPPPCSSAIPSSRPPSALPQATC